MARTIATLTGGEANGRVVVQWDAEWEEFQVRIPGQPKATYHTTSYTDAIGTARAMAGPGWVDHIRAFDVPEGME